MNPACPQGHTRSILIRAIINHAGAKMYFWYCVACKQAINNSGGAIYLKHEAVEKIAAHHGKTTDDIPILDDYRIEPCAICGHIGTEYHHWLPQCHWNESEIEPDVSAWSIQGTYLCKYHHDLWHDLITPDMPGRGKSRRTPDNDKLQGRSFQPPPETQTGTR